MLFQISHQSGWWSWWNPRLTKDPARSYKPPSVLCWRPYGASRGATKPPWRRWRSPSKRSSRTWESYQRSRKKHATSCHKKWRKMRSTNSGNDLQHTFNEGVKEAIDKVLPLIDNLEMAEWAKQLLKKGSYMIRERWKLIKIADRSDQGWKIVDEYERDPVANDSNAIAIWPKLQWLQICFWKHLQLHVIGRELVGSMHFPNHRIYSNRSRTSNSSRTWSSAKEIVATLE